MLSRITLGFLILGGVLSAAELPVTFVTQSPLPPATTNLNYTTTITATGGSGTYTFTATGLPSWLTLGPKGILSGVPPTSGPVTFNVTVTDTSSNSASQAFTLPVNSMLAIATSSPLQPATLGLAASYTLMATGGTGGYIWSSTCLPAWLSLDPSGTLSTNSTPPSGGTYTFALTVADSSNNTSSKLFTLVVESALTIVTPPAIPAATAGAPYSFKFLAAGGSGDFSEYSWSASGLPQEFSLSTTGVLTGESATAGPISFVVTVTDPASESETQKNFVLAVNSQLTISFRAPIGVGSTRAGKEIVLPTGTDDELYTGSFLVSGGTGPFTWSATGLPSWFILAPTGFLTGTPPDGTTSASFTVTVTDSTNKTASLTVTLSVNPPLLGIIPVVSSDGPPALLPEAVVGVLYSIYFCLPGAQGLSTWSAAPPLPTWLTLPPGPSSTAQLSGTPPAPGSVTFTVTASPNPGQPTSATFTLPIESAPVITDAPTQAIVGVPYTFQFTATGGSGTYSWSAAGLPSWLALSASGALMGTPPAQGPVSFTATVTDSLGATTTQSFTLQVNAALQISPTSLPAATVGMLYSVQFMGTGGTGSYTWTATGLPTWLNLSSSGLLTGTPPTPGTVTFSVTLTDSANDTTTSSFTLLVNPVQGNGLAITTTSPLPSGTVGTLYSLQFAATGGTGNYTWTATGLPTWLGLSTGGSLLGTPPTAGTLTFTVTVTDSQENTASSTFTLVVNAAQGAPLAISTTSPLPAATVGLLYTLQFAAIGGTSPYTWTSTGLPTWLSLSTGGSLTGTPPATSTITFTVTVTDGAQNAISTTFMLPVNPAQGAQLAISTTSPLPNATVGTFYSLQFAATGGTGPYTWTATGLPTWLALTAGGSLLGTPPTAGTLTFTVTVNDTGENAASATFTLLVNPVTSTPLTITTSSPPPPATVGVPYSLQFAAAGGTSPYTWTASGLPAWLTLSNGGLLTGTPPTTGTLMFTVTVSDPANDVASAMFMFPVNPVTSAPLSITTTSPLPAATADTFYSLQFAATGGTGPYTWTAIGLPGWLGLSSGGALMGTPPTSGIAIFTVTVTDSQNNTATGTFMLTANPAQQAPLAITTTSPLPSGTMGTLYSLQFAATGGTGTYTWTATKLPTWLTLSAGGTLMGTPPTTGTFSFNVTVTDSANNIATNIFMLPVNPVTITPLAITTTSPLPSGTMGTLYSLQFAATGGTGTYTWTATKLPNWLTLSAGGTLMGTPPTTGTTTFAVTVTDSANNIATNTFMLPVNPVTSAPLAITTTSPLPSATIGTLDSLQFAATGGTGTYTWTATGLPTWLSFSPAGLLTGTPPTTGTFSFNVTVTDSANNTITNTFMLPVNSTLGIPPLAITTTSPLPSATVGIPDSLQFAATGGTGSYTWTATGLPTWLSLSTSGLLTGTPPVTGTLIFNVTVTDSAKNTITTTFQLPVNATQGITPLAITTASPLPAATAGIVDSLQFTATGGTAPYTWTATGLPPSLSLSSSGLLLGTPAVAGTLTFTVSVTDSANTTVTDTFQLPVNSTIGIPPLAITTTSPLPSATVGIPDSLQFAATGGTGSYIWTATGLPTWLSLSTGGTLTGTPPVTGTLTFNLTVTDSANNTVTDTFTLPVNSTSGIAPLAITTTSPLPSATVGIPDSLQFAATGGTGPYTWTATGLPTWLSFSTGGLLTGTPPVTGPVVFNVTATDSAKTTITTTFVLPVNPTQVITPLAISTASPLPSAIVGIVDSLQFAATGGTAPYTWTATGLPPSLSLSSSGLLLGTPAVAGTLTFTVSVTDSANTTVTDTFQLPVNQSQVTQLTITTTSPLPVATVGTLYSLQFMASGGYGSYNWTAGGLPKWLSLSDSGLLIGIPPTSETLQFAVTVTDADQGIASNTFSLTVNPSRVAPLTITTTSPLPMATAGMPYSLQFAATGGYGGYSWTASGLPTWLSLSAGGLLTGTPPTSATLQFTVTVYDSDDGVASNTFALTVNPAEAPLTITTASPLPSATVDVLYSQQFAATGGTSSYSWTASGLPTWLTLNAGGLLAGTPPIAGPLQFTVIVTDSSAHTASKTFALNIAAPVVPLTITTNSPLPDATKGVFYSSTFTAANGRGTYTWTGVGLPSGLTLSTAGVLSGTPTVAGLFSLTVTVADDSQATASKTFSLAILSTGAPLQFASSALPACTVNSICSAIISATGGVPPYTFSLNQTQVIGDNLTLSPEGLISGLPTQAEVLSFSVQVTDAARTSIFQTFRLQVNGTNLTITSTTLPSGTVNTPYSSALAATGGSVYSWTIVSGSLPPGLMLNASSGAITGTPTAAGTSTFSAEVASGNLVSAPQSFSITITGTEHLTIISPLQLPPAALGASSSQMLSATGGSGGYTWTITAGSLPAGLTLAPSGAISGTPTRAQTATFTATVTDSSGTTASATFTFTVINPAVPSILTSSPLPDAIVNQPYNYPVSVTGGIAPYTWSITQGMIPDGLTFSSLTGAFSGTPTTTGSFTFTLTVLDGTTPQSLQSTQTYTIRVLAPTDFHITAASVLPNGSLNLAYQQSLAATGGTPPYTWQLLSGSWPAGISLDSTGNLSGTPTSSGTYAVVVQVIDSTGAVGTAAFSLTVYNPRVPTVAINPVPGPGILNAPYMHAFSAGGGTAPYTWTVVMGSLPPGLTLNPSTGVLSGTPTQKGNYTFTVQVTDANGTVSTQQFTIAVLSNDLTITPAALPVASLNVPYSYTLTAIGGTAPYTWSLTTGSLVAGFTLNPVTGVLSGTPTQAGTLNFDISVSDQSNDQSSQSFSLTVGAAMLTISTTQTKQTTMVGAAYSFTFAATQGDTPYTWSVTTGTLPPGLNLDGKTGTLAGTPTTAGTYSFTLQVADTTGGTAQVAITIVVTAAALAISTGSTLPTGMAGTAYSTRLESTGGSGPITWSVGSGTPPGLSLASSTGVLSGTPTMAGDFKFAVSATDSTGAVVAQTVSLVIAAPASVVATAAGLPATVNPGDQPTVTVTLAAPYPLPITVTATLQLSPSLGGTSDLLFPNGSTTMEFMIPANTTQSSFSFQAGTVAGTIQLSLSYQAAGVDITPSTTPVLSTQIVAAAPAIKSVVATQTTSGIQVVIDGLSTTRDMKSATFQFTPASGATLQTTSVTVDVSAMFAAWYQSSSSLPLGSQFSLTIPFTVNGGVNTIASVSVTLTNSVGTSAAVSATVP